MSVKAVIRSHSGAGDLRETADFTGNPAYVAQLLGIYSINGRGKLRDETPRWVTHPGMARQAHHAPVKPSAAGRRPSRRRRRH